MEKIKLNWWVVSNFYPEFFDAIEVLDELGVVYDPEILWNRAVREARIINKDYETQSDNWEHRRCRYKHDKNRRKWYMKRWYGVK